VLTAEIGNSVKKVKLIIEGCLVTDEIVGVFIREKLVLKCGVLAAEIGNLLKKVKLILDRFL